MPAASSWAHISKVLEYKGTRIRHYLTNYGTLFSVTSLLILLTGKKIPSNLQRYFISDSLTVKLPIGGERAPICTGLKGLQQIFADKPDITLEQIARALNIVEGDLPVTEDIKVVSEKCQFAEPKQVDIKEQTLPDYQTLQEINTKLRRENQRLCQELEKVKQQLRIQERLCYNAM